MKLFYLNFSINYQTQRAISSDPEMSKNRIFMFDSTFILLSRIAMVWENLVHIFFKCILCYSKNFAFVLEIRRFGR